MKHTKEVEHTTTRTKVLYVTCDRCEEEFVLDNSMSNNEEFELNFVTMSGTGIYLTGAGWEVEDLCKDCIKWLRELLENEGVRISEVSW